MSDRTTEFLQLIRSYKASGEVNVAPKPKQQPAVASLKEFHIVAADISRNIYTSSKKLSKLAKLVQSKSLFSDPEDDINRLVHEIKEEITTLNSKLESAQTYITDQKRKMGQKSQPSSHSSNVVVILQNSFANATSEFKKVLQVRSANLKAQADRRELFGGAPGRTGALAAGRPMVYKPIDAASLSPVQTLNKTTNPLRGNVTPGSNGLPPAGPGSAATGVLALPRPGSAGPGQDPLSAMSESERALSMLGMVGSNASPAPSPFSTPGNSLGRRRYTAGLGPNGAQTPPPGPPPPDGLDEESGGGGAAGNGIANNALMAQQQLLIVPNQGYLEERATAMGEVESSIMELGQIFGKLSSMISEQRELVERISDNVEDASQHIDMGRMRLVKALTDRYGNRGLALKVLGILVVFIILFVLFIA